MIIEYKEALSALKANEGYSSYVEIQQNTKFNTPFESAEAKESSSDESEEREEGQELADGDEESAEDASDAEAHDDDAKDPGDSLMVRCTAFITA